MIMLKQLMDVADKELKPKILSLNYQYDNNEYSIKDLEESVGEDFDYFSTMLNDFANQYNILFRLLADVINSENFVIIENDENLYIKSQIDSTHALIESEYIPTMAKKQEKIKFFVSYSHKDTVYVEDILNRLEASPYPFEFWKDNGKMVSGDNFKGEIKTAIQEYDFGLLMVSENFESDFIVQNELPYFVDIKNSDIKKIKCPIPLCITTKDKIPDLQYIHESIIFTYNHEGYMETLDKDEFINNFINEIFIVVEKQKYKEINTIENLQNCKEADEVHRNFINTKAEDNIDVVKEIKEWSNISISESKKEFENIQTKISEVKERKKNRALMFKSSKWEDPELGSTNKILAIYENTLKELSNEKYCSKYFALLGDSGMGKTWSCMKIALELSGEDSQLKPIYLDLRHFASSKLIDDEFNWKEIINVVVAASLHSFKKGMGINTIFEIIQNGKAFIIFDGLDEVTVHLKDDGVANAFIKELKRVVLINPNNKVLFSCRTHYFRSIQEQFSMFCGQDRERIQREDFMSLELLPFTWKQIEEYCKKRKINFQIFKEIVMSIHNLEEITQRPYSLKLITLQIRKLEELIKEGGEVNSSDIYLNIIEESLNRDSGKHTLSKLHKPLIMRELSAYMWNEDTRELEYPDLDDWFSKWLYNNKYISDEYKIENREKLKADLRGATFMVRPNSNIFRFSHTSLQEFFLAWYLYEAFKKCEYEKFYMKIPSTETIEFFIMLWKRDFPNKDYLKNFDILISKIPSFAFEIYLISNKLKFYINYSTQFVLEKNDLTNRKISGNFTSSLNLNKSIFNNVHFDNSTLINIDFSGSTFNDCIFMGSSVSYINFTNTILTNCFLKFKEQNGCIFDNIKYVDCEI